MNTNKKYVLLIVALVSLFATMSIKADCCGVPPPCQTCEVTCPSCGTCSTCSYDTCGCDGYGY